MTSPHDQRGFTLLEMVMVLAISGIMFGPIVAIVAAQSRTPAKIASELKASRQIQKATLLLTEDASAALSFATGIEPDYGTFSWYEFSGTSPVPVTVRYFWQDGSVLRELSRGGEVTAPQVLIDGVATFGDVVLRGTAPAWAFDAVSKTWGYTEGGASLFMTTTHEAGSRFADTVFKATLTAGFRPQADLPAPLPGRLPPPVPPANQVDFRIAGDPVLVQGRLLSGTGSDLTFDDTDYYRVRATGSPRTVVWEATSEAIDYTTTTDITISFTGRSTRAGVTLGVFVYNPADPDHTDGGFDTSPDKAKTFVASNTDETVLLTLAAADVDYVNSLSTKVVKIRIKATHPQKFRLFSDQLIFQVAGTPSPSFFRDYLIETDPFLETGIYVSGGFSSLAVDDTDYYRVRESGDVVQWTAVSQAINLGTVSSVQVFFTARVSRGTPVQQIYVFNPANGGDGYAVSPDSETTYGSTGTDVTVSFLLSAADVAYVNTLFPKEVRIRVRGTDSSNRWRLNGDRLVFRVKP